MAEIAPGIDKANTLRQAGFSSEEIDQWRADTAGQLGAAGFNAVEVDEYFGEKQFDKEPVRQVFKANTDAASAAKNAAATTATEKPQKEAMSFSEAFEAGWQMSATKLIQKKPTTVLPQDSPMFYNIASQIGTLAGDVPAMIAGAMAGAEVGAIGGGAIGTAIAPGPGTITGAGIGGVLGGGFGANALPATIRKIMMDKYEKGEVKNFDDFWERAAATFIEGGEAGVVGAATVGVGGVVGKVLAPVAKPLVKSTAVLSSEIATMVNVGSALKGQGLVTEPEEYIEAGIVIGGLAGSLSVASKMRKTWGSTGVKPSEVALDAKQDPVILGEMLAKDDLIPKKYADIAGVEVTDSLPKVEKQIFHGTNVQFEKFDFNKSGGMVFFAESELLAERYASDTGSGGRAYLKKTEVEIIDNDTGRKFNFNENTKKWLSKEGNEILDKDIPNLMDKGYVSYQPKNARVISELVDVSKVLDTYEKTNLEKLQNILKVKDTQDIYTTRYISRLKTAIKEELQQEPGAPGFGNEFWSLSKLSRGKEINTALKEVSKQIQDAGYVGLRFRDDRHPSIAVFENAFKKKELIKSEVTEISVVERSQAEKTILKNIGEKVEAKPEGYSFNNFYKDVVDKLDPINEAVKILEKGQENKLETFENPYQLARMANDYKAKTKYVLEKGNLDYETLSKTGKSFKEIIEPHKENTQGFEAYLVSKRAIEVEKKGKASGFDIQAAKEIVKVGKDKYENSAKEFYDWENNNLKYLKDSGVIGETAFKGILELNKNHVSFSRLLEGNEKVSGKIAGGKPGSLKEFKGSDLKIQSPLLSTLENTEAIFKIAEKNRAIKSLIELSEKDKGQTLIKKVPESKYPVTVKPEEMVKALVDQGVLEKGEIQGDILDAFTIFRKANQNIAENEFQVFRNGKREIYEVADVELAKAIKSLDGDKAATNLLFKMARTLATVKRIGISLVPEFQIKNFIRDQATATAFSKTKSAHLPFVDSLLAMKDLMQKNDNYYDWLKSGGAGGSFLELNTNYIEKNIFELNKQTKLIDKTWNVIQKPIEFMKVTGSLVEQATRLAEFKRVVKGAEGEKGKAVFAGGFASREITVDFTRVGAKLSATNAITAFQNVSIQGLDRSIRAFKEDPKGVGTTVLATITTPSVLLWYANKDDERYKGLPRWQKDLFWIVPTDDWQTVESEDEVGSTPDYLLRKDEAGKTQINKGAIYRIPKPQELGILFGSLPERVLENYFTENPKAFKDFENTIFELVTPSMIPDALIPIGEQLNNKSYFTGSRIVPGNLEEIAPEYQYTNYTSETAKQLSKMVMYVPGVGSKGKELSISSPMVLDNYIRSWTGNVGKYALQIMDQALYKSGIATEPIKPASTLADVPFVQAFVIRHPSSSTQHVNDFYDNYEETTKKFKTLRYLGKSGDFENLEKELDKMAVSADPVVKLDGIKEIISGHTTMINKIMLDKEMTPDDKRQLIDGFYFAISESAKAGNDMLNLMKKINEMEKTK